MSFNAQSLGAIFYASGTRGKMVRADGQGGKLARGWYARTGEGMCGPFTTEAQAYHEAPEPKRIVSA